VQNIPTQKNPKKSGNKTCNAPKNSGEYKHAEG
jgi:hypothetical protein